MGLFTRNNASTQRNGNDNDSKTWHINVRCMNCKLCWPNKPDEITTISAVLWMVFLIELNPNGEKKTTKIRKFFFFLKVSVTNVRNVKIGQLKEFSYKQVNVYLHTHTHTHRSDVENFFLTVLLCETVKNNNKVKKSTVNKLKRTNKYHLVIYPFGDN